MKRTIQQTTIVILLVLSSMVTLYAQEARIPRVEVNARCGIGVSLAPQQVAPIIYNVDLTLAGRVKRGLWVGGEASFSSLRINQPIPDEKIKDPSSYILFVGPAVSFKYGRGDGWELIGGASIGYTYRLINKELEASTDTSNALLKAHHGLGMNLSSEVRYAYTNAAYFGLGYKFQMRSLKIGNVEAPQRSGIFSGIPFVTIGFRL